MSRHQSLPLIALLLPCLLSREALAQTPAPAAGPESSMDKRAVAETLFFAGRGLIEAGRIPEGCLKFAESYRLDPAAGTLINLAVCHEKEGKIASAWGEFRQSLAEARKVGRSDREQLAQEHIAGLEPQLPFLTIRVPPEAHVPGLEIELNGVALSAAAWELELPVDPGTARITVHATNHKPREQSITLSKTQHAALTVTPLELAPLDVAPREYWSGRRKAAVGLAGAGLVAVGVGAVFGVMALSNRSKSDADCPLVDRERRCSTNGADEMSTARSQAWISDIAIGVGAASIVTGGILFFTGAAKQDAGVPERSAKVLPWSYDFAFNGAGAAGTITHRF